MITMNSICFFRLFIKMPLFIFIITTSVCTKELPNIISLNICADTYLVAFADPKQILALAPQSHDSRFSAFTEKTKQFPINHGNIEEILMLKPDLLILSPYSSNHIKNMALRFGIKIFTLDAAHDYESARNEILQLGKAIGRKSQASQYLRQLDQEMEKLKKNINHKIPPKRLLNIQRQGISIGKGHILDDIIIRAGAINLGRQGNHKIRIMSLENILQLHPDYILTIHRKISTKNQNMAILQHPALHQNFSDNQWITIPQNLIVCAGATTPTAIKMIQKTLHQ